MSFRKLIFLLIINIFSHIPDCSSVSLEKFSERDINSSMAYVKILMDPSLKEEDKTIQINKLENFGIIKQFVYFLHDIVHGNKSKYYFGLGLVCEEELNRIQVLLFLASDPNKDSRYDKELLNAINSANLNIREILLNEIKNNPHLQDSNGTTLLMLAIWKASKASTAEKDPEYNKSIVKLLLDLGANPNVLSTVSYDMEINILNTTSTPLMVATKYHNEEIVKLLIEYGADIGIKDTNNFTAIKIAHFNEYDDIENLLKDASEKQKSQKDSYSYLITTLAKSLASYRKKVRKITNL